MPDTTKYRALLATVLEEEGLTLHGLTPFAPLEDHLLPCRAASRLPEKPCAAVMILFPYRFPEQGQRNLSRYACVPDYHEAAGTVLEHTARRLGQELPGFSFVPFIDN